MKSESTAIPCWRGVKIGCRAAITFWTDFDRTAEAWRAGAK